MSAQCAFPFSLADAKQGIASVVSPFEITQIISNEKAAEDILLPRSASRAAAN